MGGSDENGSIGAVEDFGVAVHEFCVGGVAKVGVLVVGEVAPGSPCHQQEPVTANLERQEASLLRREGVSEERGASDGDSPVRRPFKSTAADR